MAPQMGLVFLSLSLAKLLTVAHAIRDFSCNEDSPFMDPMDKPANVNPVEVEMDFTLQDISEVDDFKRTMTLQLYFTFSWPDPRVHITTNTSIWDTETEDVYELDLEYVPYFWKPDLEIYQLKDFFRPSAVRDIGGLMISRDKVVTYTLSVYITVECPFNFDDFPMDEQICKLKLGSFYHESDEMVFAGEVHYNKSQQRFLQYDFEVSGLPEDERLQYYHEGQPDEEIYSIFGVKVVMRRIFQPFFLRWYLPSAIFVVVSWVSFTINPWVVPGRMALLVTILLMLINISNTVSQSTPMAKKLTAIEMWIFACIGFVFFTLLEYAFLLLHIRSKESKSKQQAVEDWSGQGDYGTENNGQPKSAEKEGIGKKWAEPYPLRARKAKNGANNGPRRVKPGLFGLTYRHVDAIALFVFPCSFAIFNIVYWHIYL